MREEILGSPEGIGFGISRIASRQPKRDALPSTSLRNPWSPGASQLKQSAGSESKDHVAFWYSLIPSCVVRSMTPEIASAG